VDVKIIFTKLVVIKAFITNHVVMMYT